MLKQFLLSFFLFFTPLLFSATTIIQQPYQAPYSYQPAPSSEVIYQNYPPSATTQPPVTPKVTTPSIPQYNQVPSKGLPSHRIQGTPLEHKTMKPTPIPRTPLIPNPV